MKKLRPQKSRGCHEVTGDMKFTFYEVAFHTTLVVLGGKNMNKPKKVSVTQILTMVVLTMALVFVAFGIGGGVY